MSDPTPEEPATAEPELSPQGRLEEALSFLSHDAREGHASTLALLELQRIRTDPMAINELVERVERNARRSLALIDDFIDIARARLRPLQVGEVDLVDELVDVVANAWLTANARGVRVRVTQGPEAAPAVADRELLNGALTKLVRDAAAKASRGGEVVCALREQESAWVIEIVEALGSQSAALESTTPRRPDRPRRAAHAEPGLSLARIVAARHAGHLDIEQVAGQPRLLRLTLPRQDGAGPGQR
jgi:K+-sensing histidine kinase KdpD